MNLNEIKAAAVRAALTKLIIDSSNKAIDIVDNLSTKDKFNYNRDKYEAVKEFRELQQTIDEAFSELHDPKPKSVN